MPATEYTVLVVEPDARLRSLLVNHLTPLGCTVLQAEDGAGALRVLGEREVRVIVSEMYLPTDGHADLFHAIRNQDGLRRTRRIAHTRRATPQDRNWATNAGADAFLIYPTRAQRLRYVVERLANEKSPRTATTATTSQLRRRPSLDVALLAHERNTASGLSTIVVGKEWWTQLTSTQQASYRRRAKKAKVSLRSDALLGDDYVVLRNPSRRERSESARQSSPYSQPAVRSSNR